MSKLSIRNLVKVHGTQTILNGISLDIQSGEFVVLVGPSGCGKSTTLRLIAGLDTVTSGEITIGDSLVNDVPPRDRDIAMVFQNYALYPHLTVSENMGFSLRMRGFQSSDIRTKVVAAAKLLGLEDLLERRPSQLSGGQRQRVAMGRAIVREPAVFLFDEPLSNLDAKLRNQMRSELKALHRRFRTTTVYVTHDQVEAMTLADKIVLLRKGIIEQVGTPRELYDKPANIFVASFMGNPSMNFLNVDVDHSGLRYRDQFLGSFSNFGLSPNLQAKALVMGIRPENLKEGSTGPVTLTGTVTLVENLGSVALIHSAPIPGTSVICESSRFEIAIDDAVCMSFEPKNTCFFDPISGMRVS